MNILPKTLKLPKKNKLQPVQFRGFGGGWNTIFDDISMDPRFLANAKNVHRTPSGAATVRFGSHWYTELTEATDGALILDMEYFNGRLICVMTNGEVFAIDHPTPTKTKIWSSAIAVLLPGAPTGWSSGLTQCDFVPIRDQLIIHNGVDKPIIISSAFTTTYLNDLASGSNINTPIGKYGCVVSNYHCVAGVVTGSTEVYVSHTGAAGTFTGDAAPNDGIVFDVGAYAPDGAISIRGIAGFRSNLLIFFQTQTLVVELGQFEGDVHKPKFPDSLPQHGLLGHRCIAKLSNDLMFNSIMGTSTARRNLFSGLYDSKHLNEYIEPDYRRRTSELSDVLQQKNTFSLYDQTEKTLSLYLPDGFVFVYSFSDELRYKGWSYYEDQQWTTGCTTLLGRVFFAKNNRIYLKGNNTHAGEAYAADKIADRKGTWGNNFAYGVGDLLLDAQLGNVWSCLIAHNSSTTGTFAEDRVNKRTAWELYEGLPIEFDMEMPWIDGRDPMNVKQLRFGKIGTKGSAEFTLKVYVDHLHRDSEGEEIYDPALSIDMIGQDADGYGADAGPMGGGRPSNDGRLYSLPCKFKTIKFRFTGSAKKPLIIANQSYLFSKGKYRR